MLTVLCQPLIGHNSLMDMMFLHEKFYRPLPGAFFLAANMHYWLQFQSTLWCMNIRKVGRYH